MYFFKVFVWLALLVAIGGHAYACEPCFQEIDLSGSIAEADIIAVVQRDYDPFVTIDRPETIDLRLSSLLKWSIATGHTVTVSSRVGMCPYGIIIDDDRDYLVLLETGNDVYRAVHQWCGVGVLPVVDGKVQSDGKEIDLQTFAQSRWLTLTPLDDGLSWWGRLRRRLFH